MESKKCSKCRLRLPLHAFDRDRAGTQSFCKGCKDAWEATPQGVYSRTIAWLEKYEPESALAWTLGRFMAKWEQANGRCSHCMAGLREWQKGGHSLDRIDNAEGRHIPENCVLACAPCNMTRRRMAWHPWREYITGLREKHDGEIPWGEYEPKWKRIRWRVTKHLALPDHNLGLFDRLVAP